MFFMTSKFVQYCLCEYQSLNTLRCGLPNKRTHIRQSTEEERMIGIN